VGPAIGPLMIIPHNNLQTGLILNLAMQMKQSNYINE
jgi:hypothetical protein